MKTYEKTLDDILIYLNKEGLPKRITDITRFMYGNDFIERTVEQLKDKNDELTQKFLEQHTDINSALTMLYADKHIFKVFRETDKCRFMQDLRYSDEFYISYYGKSFIAKKYCLRPGYAGKKLKEKHQYWGKLFIGFIVPVSTLIIVSFQTFSKKSPNVELLKVYIDTTNTKHKDTLLKVVTPKKH